MFPPISSYFTLMWLLETFQFSWISGLHFVAYMILLLYRAALTNALPFPGTSDKRPWWAETLSQMCKWALSFCSKGRHTYTGLWLAREWSKWLMFPWCALISRSGYSARTRTDHLPRVNRNPQTTQWRKIITMLNNPVMYEQVYILNTWVRPQGEKDSLICNWLGRFPPRPYFKCFASSQFTKWEWPSN